MSDSEWASKVARRFQSHLAEISQKDAKFLEEQKIRRDYTERLWAEIRTAFSERYMSVNKEIGRQVLAMEDRPTDNSLVLRRNEPTSEAILLRRDTASYSIAISAGKDDYFNSRLEVQIDRNSGTGYLVQSYEGNARTDPTALAEAVIEHLLSI